VADVRISSSTQALAPTPPAGRAEAVKAAQRAFFNAALVQAQPTAELKRAVTTAAASEPQTTRLNATVVPDSAPTGRLLRPGSLLDIKV
jgi:hypothetical protein